MPTPLLLGPVAFVGFEVPERLTFGGRQRLAVHRLPGGGRVIDAMGRDDAALSWSGIFSGPDAADRARMLDSLRAGGAVLPLTWDAFLYSVVIDRFEAEYSSPWWIPYRIACTVLRDEAAALAAPSGGADGMLLASVIADLADAAGGIDVSEAQAALAVDGAVVAGTGAQQAALLVLADSRARVDAGIEAAGAGLSADDPGSVADAAGTLARLSAARGFLGRAEANLAGAST